MNKEAIIQEKLEAIKLLQDEIQLLNTVEVRRLYKIKNNDWCDETRSCKDYEAWGYIETYNKESIRFCIVASDNPRHSWVSRWHRSNIESFTYFYLKGKMTRATKNDVPLLVGLTYRFPELELILKGKKKILLDD